MDPFIRNFTDLLNAYNALKEEHVELKHEMKLQQERNLLLEARIKEMEKNETPNPSVLSAKVPVIISNGQIGSDPLQFQYPPNGPAILNTSAGNCGDGDAFIDEIRYSEIDEIVGNTEDPDLQHNNCIFHGLYPFFQEPVLRLFGQFLDHNSLETGRLVCPYWNDVLASSFFKHSKMNLDFSSSSPVEIEELFSAYPISEFNAQKNWDNRLPSTVSLIIDPLKQPRGTELLQMWLPIFGNKIQDIRIKSGNEAKHISADLLTQIINSCPNLQTLRISEFLLRGSLHKIEPKLFQNITTLCIELNRTILPFLDRLLLYGTEVRESIKDILQSVPNLRILRLSPKFVEHSRERLVECLAVCQKTGCIENLLELELRNSIVTNETLDLLSQVKFTSLKSLILEPDCLIVSTTAGPALTKLLMNVRDTLEQLRIGVVIVLAEEVDYQVGSSITIESLPEMPSLKRLEINCELVMLQGSIDFLHNFPNLETLIIWDEDQDNFLTRLVSVDINFQHNSLRVLKMPRCPSRDRPGPTSEINGQHQNETLRFIVTSFPRLKVLSIILQNFKHDHDHLSKSLKILNELTELQEFSIYHEGVSDEDFNDSMAKMFKSNDLAFLRPLESWQFLFQSLDYLVLLFTALKRFRFYNMHQDNVWLNATAFQESLQYAQSLEDMELCYFRILETEKDSVLDAVKKINRVRFLHCETVKRLRNTDQLPKKISNIDDNIDPHDENFFEQLMFDEESYNDHYFGDWTFEVGTSIDAAPDLLL